MTTYHFSAMLWEYEAPASWHFISLPMKIADEIADATEGRTNGFGSVRVLVAIGGTQWATSLFPSKQRGTYVLPVKKAVRTAEGLREGEPAEVLLTVVG
jgi:hypothetical protein